MSKTVLVTGAAGFLGSNLCARLLNNGFKVIGVDNLYTGMQANLDQLTTNPSFHFVNHDITAPLDVPCDWIFNFACPASPPHYQKDPIFTTKTNVLGTLNMLELAKKSRARIMQASTSEVYGDPLVHPQHESYWGNVNCTGPRACYDEGKRCAESLCFDFHRTFNTDIRVIRIFNTYGPAMDPQDGRVISNFIMQSLQGLPLSLYGDGNQTRSFCFVDDLIAGILAWMNFEGDGCHTPCNIGNSKEITLNQLIEKLEVVLKKKLTVDYKPLPQDDPCKRKPD
ncbi:SDR family NAD(P)-dependent oxidoreductase, partial [bacterium]|nr:SDR family NAD(P)-dependent oxidoreductase [bacterium]